MSEIKKTQSEDQLPSGEDSKPINRSGISRRDVLFLGGAVALGAVVGCGGEGQTPDGGVHQSDADQTEGDADVGDADFSPDDADPDSATDADFEDDADLPADDADPDGEADADFEADADLDADLPPDGPGPLVLLHITDTHVGEGPLAAAALDYALRVMRPIIQPALIINSGDLVDEGYESDMWEDYELITGIVTTDEYMEVPGNHDTHFDTTLNNYLERSITGFSVGETSSHRVIEANERRLRVVGVNTASGEGRLRNLTGFLDGDLVDDLITSIDSDPTEVDDTIIVGHHPMIGINGLELFGTEGNLRRLIEHTGAAAYLFGHVHISDLSWVDGLLHVQGPTLGKPSMITDLGFMIIGYDEMGFSVRSVGLDPDGDTVSAPWPIVLITHPVDANLAGGNPYVEALPRESSGNILRACVFAPEGTRDISFRVNSGRWHGMEPRSTWYEAEFDTDSGGSVTLEARAIVNGQIDSHTIRVPLA